MIADSRCRYAREVSCSYSDGCDRVARSRYGMPVSVSGGTRRLFLPMLPVLLFVALVLAALHDVQAFAGTRASTLVGSGGPSADERALLGWAVHLSRYANTQGLPRVSYEPHRFFVENACLGREACRVLGWYDDRDVIYVDETLAGLDTLFARSLLVHEFVHFLQHRSGRFDEHHCDRFVEREREAYAVQQAFYVAHGAIPAVRARHYSCPALEFGDR